MKNNKKKGFTLVELLVVIAILAILSTVSVVGYSAFIERATVSNDDALASQLTNALIAYKVNENVTNANELKAAIDDFFGEGYLKEMSPQSAKYGYHFWYDIETGEVIAARAKDLGINGMMRPLLTTLIGAEGEEEDYSSFASGSFRIFGRYYLLDGANEHSVVVNAINKLENPKMTHDEWNAILSDTSAGVKEAALQQALKENLSSVAIHNENGIFTNNADKDTATDNVTNVYYPEGTGTLAENTEGYDFSNVTNVEIPSTAVSTTGSLTYLNGETNINMSVESNDVEDVKNFVESQFQTSDVKTNDLTITITTADGTELTFTYDATEGTHVVVEVETGELKATVTITPVYSSKVTSFDILIEGEESEDGKFVVELIKVKDSYQLKADNFVSDNANDPTYVPDKTVTWEIDKDEYTPKNAKIDPNTGLITGIDEAGIIKVVATSNMTNEYEEEFEIRIGEINDITIQYQNGTKTENVEFDADTLVADDIPHKIVEDGNNEFTFTLTPGYSPEDVTICDDTFTVDVDGVPLPEDALDQENNTATVTFTKAGTYTVTVSFVEYDVTRTFNVVVTNVVTDFYIGYYEGDEENKQLITDLIYKDFYSFKDTKLDMEVFVTTSDGSNSADGHKVVWSITCPDHSDCTGEGADKCKDGCQGIIDADGKFTAKYAGTYTISATVDGKEAEKSFTLTLSKPERMEITFGDSAEPNVGIDTDKVGGVWVADEDFQMGANNTIKLTAAVKYGSGVSLQTITPTIRVKSGYESYATYEGGRLTIHKAGDIVIEIFADGYPELNTEFTIHAKNVVTGLNVIVNSATNTVTSLNDKFYITPDALNNFTVDASFTFQYEGEKVNPGIKWSVTQGAEYVECTDDDALVGTFHVKAKPATGTVITIKATDSVNNLEKTINIVINELVSFEVDCSDIKNGDDLKLTAIGKNIYVAYDVTFGEFKLTAKNFKGVDGKTFDSDVAWSISGTTNEYISIDDDGNVTIKKALPDNITITATGSSDVKVTFELNVVHVKSATVGSYTLDGQSATALTPYEWLYTGTPTFTLPSTVTNVTYAVKGVNLTESPVVCDIALDYETGNTVFTESNNTLTLVDNIFSGTQTVTIKVGTELYETLTVKVVDVSSNPFDLNNIADGIKIGSGYLYRVGNDNAIALGTLFNTIKEFDKNATLTIYDATQTYTDNGVTKYKEINASNPNLEASYDNAKSLSYSDWAEKTIKFTGEGVAIIEIDYYGIPTRLAVEVVNGYNALTYADLSAKDASNNVYKNFVLHDDVTMTSGGVYTVSGNFFGNGYRFDITDGRYSNNGLVQFGIITVTSSGVLNNVLVIGADYDTFQRGAKEAYYTGAVELYGGTITNCYIYGCQTPVRSRGGTITDTVLEGGRFGSLALNEGKTTVNNLTTINQPKEGSSICGFGIILQGSNTTLEILGTLTQHNWVKSTESSYFTSNDLASSTVFSTMFGMSEVLFTYNNETWVNTGINIMAADCKVENLPDNYKLVEGSSGDNSASTYTLDPTNAANKFTGRITLDADVPTAQGAYAPKLTWTYPSGYVAKDNTVTLKIDEGETSEFDPNFLVAKKYGNTVNVKITVDGTDYTGKKIPISGTEDYTFTITYTYTDENCYNSAGVKTSDKITYTKEVKVSVQVAKNVAAPTFTFYYGKQGSLPYTTQPTSSYAGTIVTAGGNSYMMPNVSATSSDKIGSTTVNGVTIYYPIIEGINVRSGSSYDYDFYRHYPIFKAVTISDNGTTYSYSGTTSMPDRVKWESTDVTTGNSGIALNSSFSTYDNKYVVRSQAKAGDTETGGTQLVKFSYSAVNGTKYYYYVAFKFYDEKESCVTPETLVTLADGTQKEIQYVTNEDEILVWNFFTGEYAAVPASLLINHGYGKYRVLTLKFSDQTEINVIGEHGFFDVDTNEFVFISPDNVSDYIGHNFIKQNSGNLESVELVDYEINVKETDVYSILTSEYYNCFLEGMLTLTPPEVDGNFFMPFEVGTNMIFDAEQFQSDIETYGLYRYEEFADVLTEDMFNALGIKYIKVAVGKGIITHEELMALISKYVGN